MINIKHQKKEQEQTGPRECKIHGHCGVFIARTHEIKGNHDTRCTVANRNGGLLFYSGSPESEGGNEVVRGRKSIHTWIVDLINQWFNGLSIVVANVHSHCCATFAGIGVSFCVRTLTWCGAAFWLFSVFARKNYFYDFHNRAKLKATQWSSTFFTVVIASHYVLYMQL